MSTTLKRTLFFSLLALQLFAGVAFSKPVDMGAPFPDISLPAPNSAEQRNYLGLTDAQPFTLAQVSGKVVLVEILNVHCPHCQKQTGPYNKLYKMIEADPTTRGQIKMLGVAVGNSDEAIEDFISIYDVVFPIVSDRTFKLHRALRAGPTPYSLFVLRDHKGDVGVVADTHLGYDDDMTGLLAYLKDLLGMQASAFLDLNDKPAMAETETLRPPQPEQDIARMVRQTFAKFGSDLSNFHRLKLPSGRWVYQATLTRDGQKQPIFAEVASRSAICDVCHDVHFYYTFDRSGRILDFTPLYLTKYGNVEWNDREVANFSSRVIGKLMSNSWNFDPKVDAVASATMTSAIIFDNFNQGQTLLDELKQQGLLQ